MVARSPSLKSSSSREAVAQRAASHLSKSDPVLKEVIAKLGVQSPRKGRAGFEGIATAIVYQQISGAAGNAIVRRLNESAGTRGFPPAPWFVSASDERLRGCGLSPQKLAYLRDLSSRVTKGSLDFGRLPRLGDEEVIEALTEVHGVGRWTAEMYLIFALRRPDVLPVDDLGVQKGAAHVYAYRSLPSRRTILRLGARWRPYRSFATHYLWQSLQRPAWSGLQEAAKSFRGSYRRNPTGLVEIPRGP